MSLQNKPLAYVLGAIEKTIERPLIYNPDRFSMDSVVTINAQNRQLKKVINDLFHGQFHVKKAGKFVVLVDAKINKNRTLQNINPVSGIVCDAVSGQAIHNAIFFDLQCNNIEFSDEGGGFFIKDPANRSDVFLSINKIGYKDTIILATKGKRENLVVELTPDNDEVQLNYQNKYNSPIADVLPDFVADKVLQDKFIVAENYPHILENHFFQFSVIPPLGSNRIYSGIIANNLSINLIGAYNGAVAGLEVAGVANFTNHYVKGVQVAGIMNWVNKNVGGLQISGLINASFQSVKGVQFSGMLNYAGENSNAIQISGLGNIIRGETKGAQISTVYNHSCSTLSGVQISAVLNSAVDTLNGVQLSLVNYAEYQNGVQIGLVNIADSTNGFSLGLINYAKSGFRSIGFASDEVFYANALFRSGTKKFYSEYTMGFGAYNQSAIGLGIGIGGIIDLNKKWGVNLTGISYAIEENLNDKFKLSVLNRLKIQARYQMSNHLVFNTGPIANVMFSRSKNNNTAEYESKIPPYHYFKESYPKFMLYGWIGAQASFSYVF